MGTTTVEKIDAVFKSAFENREFETKTLFIMVRLLAEEIDNIKRGDDE